MTTHELGLLCSIVGKRDHLINYAELAINRVHADESAKDRERAVFDERFAMTHSALAPEQPQDYSDDPGCSRYFNGPKDYPCTTYYSDDKAAGKAAGLPCLHLETRYRGVEQLRDRLGIRTVHDLKTFDFEAYWSERLVLVNLDPSAWGRQYRDFSKERAWDVPPFSDQYVGSRILRMIRAQDVRLWARAPGQSAYTHNGEHFVPKHDVYALGMLPVRPPTQDVLVRPTGFSISEGIWHAILPLLPQHENRHPRGGGRKRHRDRVMMNVAFTYALGLSLRDAAAYWKVSKSAASRRCRDWIASGTFRTIANLRLVGLEQISWTRLRTA